MLKVKVADNLLTTSVDLYISVGENEDGKSKPILNIYMDFCMLVVNLT